MARVLPGLESVQLCYDAGLTGKQIIAMQGPFSEQMNRTIIGEYGISALVMKESGKTGGADEKLRAAKAAGISCYVIRRPVENKQEVPAERAGAVPDVHVQGASDVSHATRKSQETETANYSVVSTFDELCRVLGEHLSVPVERRVSVRVSLASVTVMLQMAVSLCAFKQCPTLSRELTEFGTL